MKPTFQSSQRRAPASKRSSAQLQHDLSKASHRECQQAQSIRRPAASISGWKNASPTRSTRCEDHLLRTPALGRVAHPDMRKSGLPMAPSPLPAQGKFQFPGRELNFPLTRALTADEIPAIIDDFAQATRNAREIGPLIDAVSPDATRVAVAQAARSAHPRAGPDRSERAGHLLWRGAVRRA